MSCIIFFTVNPVNSVHFNSAPFIFMGWQQTNAFYWYVMVFLGLSAALAIYFIILAYQIYKPSYSSIYEYSYLISAGFFGWLFWNQIPSLMSLIGILAIIFAGINIAINSSHNDENEKIYLAKIKNYNDVKVGDYIEVFQTVQIKREIKSY